MPDFLQRFIEVHRNDRLGSRIAIGSYVPALRPCHNGDDAPGLLQFLLRVRTLQDFASSKGWGLLCLLLVWVGQVSARAVAAILLSRLKRFRMPVFWDAGVRGGRLLLTA